MCGIAGMVGPGADRAVMQRQLEILDHRGPDSAGVYDQPGVLLGQTRLAVIDLDTGDPPIVTEHVGVVLNGEIYDFRRLRHELLERGHRFTTSGDTEVIAHLAEELDPVALAQQLDGMFAFATHDKRTGRVVLARDRFGKKPLFYWWDGRTLVFASEIKALLVHPQVPRRLDPDALPDYLSFGYVPTPWTIFEGIRSLPPGHVLVLDQGAEPIVQPYWTLPVAGIGGVEHLDIGMAEAAALVREGLTTAVRRRLVSDVPVGAFLSGGIDSSAIVGVMAGLSDQPVHTFTIGFEDTDGFDERVYARAIAERFATKHVEFVVKPDAVALVDELVAYHDQPFGDSSAIPTYLLSQLTREHVTVALCGDGGDELFAGYQRFTAALLVERYRHVPRPIRSAVRRALFAVPSGRLGGRVGAAKRLLGRADLAMPDAYRSWLSYVSDDDVDALVGGRRRGHEMFRTLWDSTRGGAFLDRLLAVNVQTYLLDDLLPKVDRMSMAHALEVRAPFLDTELAELAMRLPPVLKHRGRVRKRVLKEAVSDLVPSDLLRRPKRGFGVPLDRWFREDLHGLVDATLLAKDARVRAHLRGDALDQLWAGHLAGRSHGHALWTLLTLETFLRQQDW
jgi:asparagine synthase (glutamine-hydrolysing)